MTFEEAKVILVFHIVGTVMEVFKTHVGSWVYVSMAKFGSWFLLMIISFVLVAGLHKKSPPKRRADLVDFK